MLPASKRRLNQLWKRRMNLEAKVNLLIERRFGRFREGTLSSEDFEKATRPERNLDRVNQQITKIEKRLPRPQKGFYRSWKKYRIPSIGDVSSQIYRGSTCDPHRIERGTYDGFRYGFQFSSKLYSSTFLIEQVDKSTRVRVRRRNGRN